MAASSRDLTAPMALASPIISKCTKALTADKFAHCKASHPKVSWKKLKALDRKHSLGKAAVTRRGREGIKRLGAAKGTYLEGFRLFCWPRATTSKVFAARGGLKSSFGWMCLGCQSAFRRASDAISQRGLCCPTIAKHKAARRIAAIKASWARTPNSQSGHFQSLLSRPGPCCISLAEIFPAVTFSFSQVDSHDALLLDIPSL